MVCSIAVGGLIEHQGLDDGGGPEAKGEVREPPGHESLWSRL
jgi:hypothetical protein